MTQKGNGQDRRFTPLHWTNASLNPMCGCDGTGQCSAAIRMTEFPHIRMTEFTPIRMTHDFAPVKNGIPIALASGCNTLTLL